MVEGGVPFIFTKLVAK